MSFCEFIFSPKRCFKMNKFCNLCVNNIRIFRWEFVESAEFPGEQGSQAEDAGPFSLHEFP